MQRLFLTFVITLYTDSKEFQANPTETQANSNVLK